MKPNYRGIKREINQNIEYSVYPIAFAVALGCSTTLNYHRKFEFEPSVCSDSQEYIARRVS